MIYQTNQNVSSASQKKFGYLDLLKWVALVGVSLSVAFLVVNGDSKRNSSASSVVSLETDKIQQEVPTNYALLSETKKYRLFQEFQHTYKKTYADEDETSRKFSNFQRTLELIDKRNALEQASGRKNAAIHGITKFADLSVDEFRQMYLGQKMAVSEFADLKRSAVKLPKQQKGSTTTYQNWYEVYTTSVNEQGSCGASWAFSTTEQIESDSIRAGLLTTAFSSKLSPQKLLSCVDTKHGCDGGGSVLPAYVWLMENPKHSMDYLSAYPYTSSEDAETDDSTAACSHQSVTPVIQLTGYTALDSEDDMISYVLSTGPLSISIDAHTFATYKSGIIGESCETSSDDDDDSDSSSSIKVIFGGPTVDHCMQAIGLDTEEGYWIIRPSWGTDYGDNGGFIWLNLGTNTCYIDTFPTYTTVEAYSSSSTSGESKSKST